MAECPARKRRFIIVHPSRLNEFENSFKAYDRDEWNAGIQKDRVNFLWGPTINKPIPDYVWPHAFWDFVHTNYKKPDQWRIVLGKREGKTPEWAIVQFNNADDWLHCKLKWKGVDQ